MARLTAVVIETTKENVTVNFIVRIEVIVGSVTIANVIEMVLTIIIMVARAEEGQKDSNIGLKMQCQEITIIHQRRMYKFHHRTGISKYVL